MKILIIEDEPKTGEYLRQGLKEASFIVDLVHNGNDGLHTALEGEHDLIILDVMLPGMDGWEVMTRTAPSASSMTCSNRISSPIASLHT